MGSGLRCLAVGDILHQHFAVDFVHAAEFFDAVGQEAGVLAAGDGLVDEVLQALLGQLVQALVEILADVGEEGADLLVIDDAHQRHALAGGEDEAMQTHGDHDLHPGEDADGLGGGEGLGEEVVGGGHFLGHPLGGGDVQPRLDGEEDRGQAVCLIDVIRGGGQVLDAGLEAGPGAQDEADVLPVGGDAAAVQDAVDDLRRCGGEAHGGVGREGDGGLGHAQDLQLFPGVGVPQGDGIDVFVHHLGGAAAVAVYERLLLFLRPILREHIDRHVLVDERAVVYQVGDQQSAEGHHVQNHYGDAERARQGAVIRQPLYAEIQEQYVNIAMLVWGCVFCLIAGVGMILSKNFDRRKRLWMILLQFATAVLLLSDATACIFRGWTGIFGYWIVRISNFIVFLDNNIILYLFHRYVCSFIFTEQEERTLKRATFINILCAVAVALVIISQFTDLYYYYDAQNVYHRSEGFIISIFIPVTGMMVEMSFLIEYRKKLSNITISSLGSYIILPIVAAIIQFYFYEISLIDIAVCNSMIVMYITVIGEQDRKLNNLEQKQIKTEAELEISMPNRKLQRMWEIR